VHPQVLEVEGHPAAVNENATLFTLLIQVGVEGCDDLNSLLSVFNLLNLGLLGVVEDASKLDLLERVVALKSINGAGLGLRPGENALILGGDVNWLLSEQLCSIHLI
jgi:hypothetical protein